MKPPFDDRVRQVRGTLMDMATVVESLRFVVQDLRMDVEDHEDWTVLEFVQLDLKKTMATLLASERKLFDKFGAKQ